MMTDVEAADSKGSAGAPEKKIDIPPVVIEAGVAVLRRYEAFCSLSPTLESLLVSEIVEATLAAFVAA